MFLRIPAWLRNLLTLVSCFVLSSGVVSTRAATITNTNVALVWNSTGAGWKTTINTPWDSTNGRTNTALFTNRSSGVSIASSGVLANGVSLTNANADFAIGGGTLTFGGTGPTVLVSQSSSVLTLSNSIQLSGASTMTKSGSGTLVMASSNTFAGTIAVSAAALTVAANGWLGNSTITIGASNSAPYLMSYGTVGTVIAPASPSSFNPNVFLSNSTVRGQLNLSRASNGLAVYGYASNSPAGYATVGSGSLFTNALVNGRLDIIGAGSLSISGVGGQTNGVTSPLLTGFQGSGLLAISNTWANGGAGNSVAFAEGRNEFSALLIGPGSFATLTQSGSSTTTFGVFGTGQASNSQITLSGGTWLLGTVGRTNTGVLNLSTNIIAGSASVTVSNTGFDGGVWNVTQGSLTMVGNVMQKNFPQQSFCVNVSGSGTFNATGTFRLGNSWYANTAGFTNRLLVDGGTAVIGSNAFLGSQGAITNDTSLTTVTNGGSLLIRGGLTVGDMATNNLGCVQRVVLAGGELLVAQTLNAGNSNATCTNGLTWSAGQLSAYTVVTTNAAWNDPSSAIRSGVLSNAAGTLAPGDIGTPGLNTIQGSYVQGGAGTLLLDLGGTNAPTLFQHTNGGCSDMISVSGTAMLGGSITASLCQGYIPQASDVITILTASNGMTGSFTNVPLGKSVNVDGANGFILGTNGNTLQLSSYHRIGAPVITSQSSAPSVALGGSASFSLSATSPIPQSYQWYFNSNPIPGETNSSLFLTNAQSTDSGTYYALVSNADGATNSVSVALNVLRFAAISIQPFSLMVPAGAAGLFSVTATSPLTMSYQWRFNGNNIAGATNASYAVPGAQSGNAGIYDVVVTTPDGSVTSAPAQLALLSGSLLSITNTDLSGAWGEGGSNWSSAPVTNPFSSANGAYVAAVFTNGFGSILSLDTGGVSINTLTYSNASGSLLFTGGGIGFAGNSPSLVVQSGSLLQFASSASLGVAGGGTITKSGTGSLRVDGIWNDTGTLAVQQGNLSVGSSGDLSGASVILSALTSMTLNGTAGSIRVGGNGYNMVYTTGTGSAGSPNFTAANAVITGALVIDPPPDSGKMAYASPNMPASSVGTNYGYGTVAGTMTVSNLVVGGRLDINGNQPMSISVSGGFTNGPSNYIGRGSGIIVNNSRNTSTNEFGGVGNVLSFSNGAVLAGFFNSTNTTATLIGSGTVTIGMFGQGAGNTLGAVPAGSLTYLSGGTWRIGQAGQNNSYQCAAGSFVVTNGANVLVGGNTSAGGTGFSHGAWLVQQGNLQFLSSVAEGNGGLAALIHTLQLRVASNGILTVNGDLQLGVNGSSGTVTGPPSEISIWGGSGTLTGLLLGNANSTTAGVTNGMVNALLESGSLSIGANGLCVGYDGANLISGASNSFLLSGGKLLIDGNLRAGSSPGQTNSFRWTGGQLTVFTVTATNAGWNNPFGSIRAGSLYQDKGILAPGDVSAAGLTTVAGNYIQGPGAVLDINIGGNSAATSFTNGTGFHDRINVSGTATISGALRIRLLPGFTPSSSDVFQILMASNGVSGVFSDALSSGRYATEDGTGSFVVTVASNMITLGSFRSVTPTVIVSQPESAQVVAGSNTTLSVGVSGTNPTLSYQWRFNGGAIPGGTNSSLTLAYVDASAAGSYDVAISTDDSRITSSTAVISLAPPPAFALQPASVTISNGQDLTLGAFVTSTLPYTLQWRRNGIPVVGATNQSLAIASATVSLSGSYDLVASSAAGSVVSDPAAVTVLPLTYAPMQGIAAIAGSSNLLSVSATSSSAVGYQWKRDGLIVPGATNAFLRFPSINVSDAGLYAVTITNALGSLTTEEVAVVVVRPFSNPTSLFYPLSNAPVSGTNAVTDFSERTAGTLITPVTNGGTVSRIMATNLPALLTNEPIPSGRAWDFGQTPSYVTVSQSATNPIPLIGDIDRTDGVSLAFWVNFDFYNAPVDTRDNRRILSVGNGTTIDVRTGHTAGMHKGIISAYFGNNVNIPQFFVSTPAASTSDNAVNGKWHHVAVTVDYTQALNNVRLYVDGTNVATQTEPVSASFNTTNQPVMFGGRNNNTLPTQLQGKLAMLGLFTRALTPGEIGQLVTLPAIANFAPTVAADSCSHILEWPDNSVNLLGIATDDGIPAGQGIAYRWTQVSGNGNVTFDQATNASTAAAFSAPGTYVLRLTAGDGQYVNSADVTVNVATNSPPVVYTGASVRTTTPGTTVSMTGGATDDGLPISGGGVLSYSWSQLSGPATASFDSPSSNNTLVSLPSQPGDYVFGLKASDGYQVGSNSVTVTVVPALPPVVKVSSPAPMIDLNATNATMLLGAATGSGTLSYYWTQVSGPSATIMAPGSATSPVTLGGEGDYQFRLTVGNGPTSSSSDLWISAVKATPGVPFPSSFGTNPAVNMGSSTPAPFVHPRIFFTEEDRPALRAAMTDTNNPVATNAIVQLMTEVTNSIDKPYTPIGAAYARLKVGDPDVDIQGVAKLSDVPYKTFQGTASSGLYGVLASACYLAWLDQNNPATQQRLKDLATAVATAARQHSTWYLYDRMYWSGSTNPSAYSITSYDVYSDLALCYDFIYNWMTEEQRGVTRKLLADMTYGRLTQGATEEDYVLSTNHRIFHDHLVIAQLAIEGEPGYDAASVATNRQKLKSYFNVWGIAKEGFNREGPGYFAFGMHNGTPSAYALSRRGENLFVTTHLYASFQEYFYQMAPDDTGKMYGHHDGSGWGNGAVSSTYYAIMKSVYPTDPYIDHIYRKGWENNVYSRMPLTCAIFARPFVTSGKVREVAAAKGMSPSIFSPQRGIGVSRSDWSTNAIFVDYDCRGDTMQLGHLHSDRNSFTMYALGREWFMGQGYHLTENDSKQTVLIDGLGAAGSSITRTTNSPLGGKWPSLPGKFVEFSDSARLTIMAGDSAPSYNYSWASINFNDPKQTPTNSAATPYRWRDLFYPGMQFPKQYKGDDTWLDTTILADAVAYNPVAKAFRTLLLVRGGVADPNATNTATYPRSYTLILDDIRKQDTNTHGFTWSGNTISGYNVADMVLTNATTNSAVMYHSNDLGINNRPQLLVAVAHANGSAAGPVSLDSTSLDNGEGPQATLRVQVTRTNTISPDFKILLYPHLNGEILPTTSYTNSVTNGVTNGILTVNLPNGSGGWITDVFRLRSQSDGRTRVASYARNGVAPPVIAVPSGVSASTGSNSAIITFSVSATDSSGNPVVTSANPASGSSFPIGTTPVTVSTSDSQGNTATETFNVTVTNAALPDSWRVTQVGPTPSVGPTTGSVGWDTNSGSVQITGRGSQFTSSEAFTLLSRSWTGDGVMTARLGSVSGFDSAALGGLIIRASTNAGAVGTALTMAGNVAQFRYRTSTNGSYVAVGTGSLQMPEWLRLARRGTSVTAYVSDNGEVWTQVGSTQTIALPTNSAVEFGLAAAPNTVGYSSYATFDNVSLLDIPLPPSSVTVTNSGLTNTVNWTASSGATGYRILRSTNAAGPFVMVGSLTNGMTYRDIVPSANTSYFYRVSADNGSGSGGSVQSSAVQVPVASQTITFPALGSVIYSNGLTVGLGATASSGLPVGFGSADTNVVSISGSNVTVLGAGTASIVASQGGDSNYVAATPVTNSLVVGKGIAVLMITGTNMTYDGAAKAVSVEANPTNAAPVIVTYSNSIYPFTTNPPTNAGSYVVTALVDNTNYSGSTNEIFIIAKATPIISFGSTNQPYNGSPRSVAININPTNLPVVVTYAGFTNAPSAVGSYTVAASVNEANYSGDISSTLRIYDPVSLWRQAYFGTTSASGSAADTADPNGNGLSNIQDYALGIDPLTPTSGAPISITTSADSVTVTFLARKAGNNAWYAGLARHYSLEGTTNLTNSSWSNLPGYSDITGADQTITFSTNNQGFQKWFFRLKAWLQ